MLNINRTRPLGITIIAIVMAIYGILAIIGGIAFLGSNSVLGITSLIMGILELVLAWGMWTLQKWAFWTTVVLEVLAVLNGIFAFAGRSTAGGIFGVVIALLILIYLFADRNVRPAFHT
jgi:uncharacterized membrane protein (DUF2068 family)